MLLQHLEFFSLFYCCFIVSKANGSYVIACFALRAQSFHGVGEVLVPIYPTRGATPPRPCINECMSFKQSFFMLQQKKQKTIA
jgi:hypothetical protein